ncbi:MAG: DNA polymerase III subunit delta' [Desulfonatronovibrio sp.]
MWDSRAVDSQSRIASFMHGLRAAPPNCILLEGGASRDRRALALYWAMLLNCRGRNAPCLECRPCIQIKDEVFRDLYFLGPGNKVEEIRALRTIYPQKPGFSWRIVIIDESQALRAASVNALLKSLEEPLPGNSFVLLSPQRESLFPTLVSRSFVLTLSRDLSLDFDEDMKNIFADLARFVRTGKGWLDRTSGRDKPDLIQARQLISRCRQELISSVLDNTGDNLFAGVSPQTRYQIQKIFKQAEAALMLDNMRVDLVLEWLGVNLWKKINQREQDVYGTRYLSV